MLAAFEEVPGLYGAFRIPEKLIQKIWLRGEFDKNALRTTDGDSIHIRSPGKWNLSGEGPDFLCAEIEIAGSIVLGDVEIHFRSSDWRAHGHHKDPSFERVVLHVILFPLSNHENCNGAITLSGIRLPTIELLPVLHESLEEFAERDAIRSLSGAHFEEILSGWLEIAVNERRARLLEYGRERWDKKRAHAQKRLSGECWSEACHQFTLEILGYRRNRAPMSAISLSHTLSDLSTYKVNAKTLFLERKGEWKLAGLRPANHPEVRLAQYLDLVEAGPTWTERLFTLSCDASGGGAVTRKSLNISGLRKIVATDVLSGEIGGSRLDTLVVDGFLPLLAAKKSTDFFPYWFNWYAGDLPAKLKTFLLKAEIAGPGTGEAFSNGLLQGALGYFLQKNLL
ncbi:MAG: hypothetical protein CMI26_07140 [Opitutae bacterium]|nr:hypothetical protein [Opitutae bacterium]